MEHVTREYYPAVDGTTHARVQKLIKVARLARMSRVIVVSGGGTGIGRATAAAFAAAGERVVILGRRADVLEEAAGQIGAEWHAADLADPDQVQAVADQLDTVDVLVNNAGGITSLGPKDTLADVAAAWQCDFDNNVLTAVLLTTALRPKLRRPGGRVILMSSIAALRGGGGAYSGAKAALHGWGLDLATELGPEGITVNLVAPGYVAETEFFGTRNTQAAHAARVRQTLVNRAGAPDDIAAAIRYLASPEAGYVTGQILQVNGGALLGR
jgi:3-oxoacyl-[acyl-carrier protein] reductase